MRIDERIASGAEPAFSFEFFPPKTDEGEANLAAALPELARLDPTFVSVTYGAGGTPAQRGKTIDIVSRIKADHGLEAMAHFTCVGATVDELRATLDHMRDAGIENVLALRGDPPAGVDAKRVGRGRRRPALLPRADRADPRRLRLRGRRRVLPGGPSGGRVGGVRPALHAREGRRRRALPDHPAVLRQPALLRLRRPRARRRHRRPDHPGHHADHERRPDPPLHADVRRLDPARPAARARAARRPAGGGRRLRRRLRDDAVRRPARQRRARHPLLHAQPLALDARDPQRAALPRAVAARGRAPSAAVRRPPGLPA